tara:strand:+ start:205 stop:537 length:333 start_codon:yes stop_codon:yes gene_type:complete
MATTDELIVALGDGSRNAKTALKLQQELNMDAGHTQEPTRDLIRSAIIEQNIPIGSTSNGYFLINDESEMDRVIGGLKSRILGLQNRIECLKKGWRDRQLSRQKNGNWPK